MKVNCKGDVESICARVIKRALKCVAKAEVNLNWLWTIDYGLFPLYIHGQFSPFDTNALTGFMISLFLAAPAPRVRRAWNLMRASVPDWLRFFLLFAKNYYFKQKLSFLINTLFGNVFRIQEWRLNATVCKTLMLKKYFNSWKKYFLVWHFIKNQVFRNFCLISMFFSVCSLFKLM